MKGLRAVLMLSLVFFFSIEIRAQLTVDKSLTIQQLVEDVFVGNGIASVSNITYNGIKGIDTCQIAKFSGSMVGGFSEGLLLTSGHADYAAEANGSQWPTSYLGPVFSAAGSISDLDLSIMTGKNISDASILEFDFIPEGNFMEFEFVFGSEEYPEYTCGGYNDAFAFFVSGPGITNDPFLSGKNIALLPGTNIPITINNVNDGIPGVSGDPANCPYGTAYSQYYVSNPRPNSDPFYTVFNGLTIPIKIEAKVQCFQTYHLKIVIGDGTDTFLDSGLFLKAKSFKSKNAKVFAKNSNDPTSRTITEGCDEGIFELIRTDPSTQDTMYFSFQGTAGLGDFSASQTDTMVFMIGDDTLQIDIDLLQDNVPEGLETVIMHLEYENSCGGNDTIRDTLFIQNREDLEVTLLPETFCLDSTKLIAPVINGGVAPYTYSWMNGESGASWSSFNELPGFQSVRVDVTDICSTVGDSTDYEIEDCFKAVVRIPNVITPNGDGQNEDFVIVTTGDPVLDLKVFNRWGKKVFEQNNYQNDWSPVDLPEGVYFYRIQSDGMEIFEGMLSVFR